MNSQSLSLLFGNDEGKRSLVTLAVNRQLPHALILEGPDGSGKSTLARLLMASAVCRESDAPCLLCDRCRKIMEDNYADTAWIVPQKDRKTIGVESVRSLRETLYALPGEGDFKFYCIRDAALLTEAAQNALLKTLEEPPAFAFFLLLTSSVTSLLPTVRSRAPSVRMQIFTEEELDRFLSEKEPKAVSLKGRDPDAYRRLLRSAGGRIGEAVRLLGSHGAAEKSALPAQHAASCLRLLSTGSRAELIAYLFAQPLKRDELCDTARLILSAVRDLIVCKRGKADSPLLFYQDREEAASLASHFSFPALLRLSDTASRLYLDTETINLNARLATLALADGLWNAVKQKPSQPSLPRALT